ncbi:MAG: PQQ-binding-like beta-propeller repeat protein [Planctomycetaceae bacterium]|nr:PQQ-binding-like beta-propeller repeat protein [Planctomycetaceae bacterium]
MITSFQSRFSQRPINTHQPLYGRSPVHPPNNSAGSRESRILSCPFLLIAASVVQLTLSAAAADWTEFRGPDGQGHSQATQLPLTWSETENIAWKVAIPGVGWSSPVVAEDRIYLTTAIPVDADDDSKARHSLQVLCLKADDGAVVWQKEVFEHGADEKIEMHEKNSHASPTPILDGDDLFVHFGPHGTACLKTDGTIVWKNQNLTYAPQHGNGGSPALADGVLVICCDGKDQRFVVGLDRSTGQQIWRTGRELDPSRGFSFCTPTITETNGHLQAICPGSGGVWSYDVKTGEQLWRVAYGEGYSVVPRPVLGHGLVYVCSGFGDQQLFAIDPTGSGDITDSGVRWKIKKSVPKSPSILLVGNDIYMVDDAGIASCVDALTGELHWQQRLNGKYSASPSYADGKIWFQDENGTTVVVEPGHEYQEVARNTLGDGKSRTFASFAFLDHAILLRSETHLYRIQKAE